MKLISRPADNSPDVEKWEKTVTNIINNVHYEEDDALFLNHEHGRKRVLLLGINKINLPFLKSLHKCNSVL